MGYAKTDQTTAGIHTRLYSRAYIFDDGADRAVFVSVDMGMMGHLIKRFVLDRLAEEYGGDVYRYDNVVLSGTHTHSGPGGFQQYVLLQVTTFGFIDQAFEGLVDGIVESIIRAHENVQPARLFFNVGELTNANINRSPTSYQANPAEERAMYDADTDHIFSQLNILAEDTLEPLGIINWFAVHPVSMNNQNQLISGDNKGAASLFMENLMNGEAALPGSGPFAAAFASTNLGDVSPNLNGPKCADTGLACDMETSTCENGGAQACQADGPGSNIFQSTMIIAQRQFDVALDLLEDAENGQEITGSVSYINQWIDMNFRNVTLDDGGSATTCPAALGYSFAAGCTDGAGSFNFIQGSNETNIFWETVIDFVFGEPSSEQESCQLPKPILFNTGEWTEPYLWHPNTIDTQILRLGDLYIAAMPGEFSTMAGRRMRNTIMDAIENAAGSNEDAHVVLAGLCNVYTHYITTFEEYQRQRYEAASTLFGPHTLRAYQEQYTMLTEALINGDDVEPGDEPPNLYDEVFTLKEDPPPDGLPEGFNFGDLLEQPAAAAQPGDTVTAIFVGANLRNDLMLEDSFLWVEFESEGEWIKVYSDADWETKMYWDRGDEDDQSVIEIVWAIPDGQQSGNYRITHQGFERSTGALQFYSGTSDVIAVGSADRNPSSGASKIASFV